MPSINIKLRDLGLFLVFWILASIGMYQHEMRTFEKKEIRLNHSMPYMAKVTKYSYYKNAGSKARTYYLYYEFFDNEGKRREGMTRVPKSIYYKYRTKNSTEPLPILQDSRQPSNHEYRGNWTKVKPYDDVEIYGIAIISGLFTASIIFFITLITTPMVRKVILHIRKN